MRRRHDHGLHNLVVGTALVLAAVVLYFAASNRLRRPPARRAPPPPEAADAADAGDAQPGLSENFEAVTSIPPLMLQKTGRPAGTRPQKAPPPPPSVSAED